MKAIEVDQKMVSEAKQWILSESATIPFFSDFLKSTLIMSHALNLEIGGLNDNLARHFIFTETAEKIGTLDLSSELMFDGNQFAVKFRHRSNLLISLKAEGLKKFCRPFEDGFLIPPGAIAKAISEQGVEPVFVKDWLVNSIFSDFDPRVSDYREKMWELVNNDSLTYAKLVAKKQMVFQSLHDIVEHSIGISSAGWSSASIIAKKIETELDQYFHGKGKGSISSHIVPFVIGVLLDDLTQSPSYACADRTLVIEELLRSLKTMGLSPFEPKILKKFPPAIELVLKTARTSGISAKPEIIQLYVNQLTAEVYRLSA
jgi:hypothetical protein